MFCSTLISTYLIVKTLHRVQCIKPRVRELQLIASIGAMNAAPIARWENDRVFWKKSEVEARISWLTPLWGGRDPVWSSLHVHKRDRRCLTRWTSYEEWQQRCGKGCAGMKSRIERGNAVCSDPMTGGAKGASVCAKCTSTYSEKRLH